MARYVLALLLVGLVVYAIIDCIRADDDAERYGLPKFVWLLLIVLTGPVGALAWIVLSRMADSRAAAAPPAGGRARRGPLAPDDDPEFLAGLGRAVPPQAPRSEREPHLPASHDEPPAPEDGDDAESPEQDHPANGDERQG